MQVTENEIVKDKLGEMSKVEGGGGFQRGGWLVLGLCMVRSTAWWVVVRAGRLGWGERAGGVVGK